MLKNVQQTIIKLKVMLKETADNRYTEKLNEDIDKLLKSCVHVNRAAEKATIDKKKDDDLKILEEAGMTHPWFVELEGITTMLCGFYKKVTVLEGWYIRYKRPEPAKKKAKKEEEEEGEDDE